MTNYQNGTICGVSLDAFAGEPTPAELGAIVAHWDDDKQAEFFMDLAQSLQNCCGFKVESQIAVIGQTLVKKEKELLDGKASAMIATLAKFIAHYDRGEPLEWPTH